jgi:uncharacterized caspase-like protein/uncharacterized protein YgiM (DUF1202 family)
MRFFTALIIGLVCLVSNPVQAASIDYGRYHALVIGNNKYEHLPQLETAVSDAAAVAEILRLKYGFEVNLLINATRGEILSAVNTLRAELTEEDRLLVYYAGHGELDRATGTGYWLPVDAEPNDDTNWVPNESLSRHFKGMSARHVMVVADSCYSGALVRAANVAPKAGAERDAWLKRIVEKRARTALVSGGLEPVVDEGSGGHSVFANAFLGVLRENTDVLDGQAIAKRVTQKVILGADQTPQYSDIRKAGHEGGDFLFVPTGSTVVVVPPTQSGQTDTRTFDLALWNSVKDSKRPDAFEAYLAQFPNGMFAAIARIKLDELKGSAEPAPPKQQKPTPAKQQVAAMTPPRPAIEVEEVDETFVAIRNANLRSGPTTKSEKVATLKKDAEVPVTGRVKDAKWYRVAHKGTEAYVYAPLLQEKGVWEEVKAKAEEREREAQKAAEERRREARKEAAEREREAQKVEVEARREARKRKTESEPERVASTTSQKPIKTSTPAAPTQAEKPQTIAVAPTARPLDSLDKEWTLTINFSNAGASLGQVQRKLRIRNGQGHSRDHLGDLAYYLDFTIIGDVIEVDGVIDKAGWASRKLKASGKIVNNNVKINSHTNTSGNYGSIDVEISLTMDN